MVSKAADSSIPIDGLVVMYNDIEYGKSLGRVKHHYKNGIALKFKEEEEETTIKKIDWRVGRTGKSRLLRFLTQLFLMERTFQKLHFTTLAQLRNS